MTKGPEQLGNSEQGPQLPNPTGRGSERFDWKGAIAFGTLFAVTIFGGTYLAQIGAREVFNNFPLADYQKDVYASMVSSVGYGIGFLGSIELAGRLGWIERPNWGKVKRALFG